MDLLIYPLFKYLYTHLEKTMPKSPGGALLSGFNIERNTSVPIYRQLDASLRRLILGGTLASGQKLPSTRELSNELGISRITVKSVYEQLVADQENQIKRLIEYCHLPWDDACLEFHKTRRKVRTASNAQVRRPIYQDSVKLWKRYEKQLQPLQAALMEINRK